MAEHLDLGIVVPAFFYVPYWAAVERGFYADVGLDVEITVFGGIDAVTKALRDGRVQVGIGSPEHVIPDVEATAMDMIRKDRTASFSIPDGAEPDRYVALEFLAAAQALVGIPVRAIV